MTKKEYSEVTSAINTLFHSRYNGKDYGVIQYANHEYGFDINEFNEYVFVYKRKLD